MQSQSNNFLGRQPILDRAGRLVAYELLFQGYLYGRPAVLAA